MMRALARNRSSVGALVGSSVAQGLLVISGPATARLLGVAPRGKLALLVIIVTITSQIAALGLPTAVAYFTSSSGVSARQVMGLLLRAWVSLCLGAAVVVGAVSFLVSRTNQAGSGWLEAALSVVYVVSVMNYALMFACLQGERRFTPMNWLRIVTSSLSAIALFVLLAAAHHTPLAPVFGIIVLANVVGCLLGVFLVLRAPTSPYVDTHITVRSLLRFGTAAMPAANAPLETLSLDQTAVGIILPREELGLYVVAAAFDNLPSILMNAYGQVALTRITAEKDLIARHQIIRKTALGAICISAGASVLAEAIVGWLLPFAFGANFAAAIPVARVLIVAGFLLSFRRILIVFLQAAGRPGRTAVGEVIGLGTLALGAAALVPLFGMIGAAYALILGAVVADIYLLRSLGWIL
jgi:O-antigen/teichoic acid export membrane protein